NTLFRERTKQFAIGVIAFIETIPFNTATRILTYQLGKAGTSVGANFRAFTRGRSKNERFAKICIVVEEADESIYWLEIFSGTPYGDKTQEKYLMAEGTEILKVTTKIKDSMFKAFN
ncbi:MAG TPA: four helix bundle protein, partial [Saprospiraceae bacterium]|nr:four helix bundle protein [Saprospiraceae bacterium]